MNSKSYCFDGESLYPTIATRPQKKLSQRERQCVMGLASGLQTTQIASSLGIADVTVNLYISNAKRKFAAKTRAHLVAMAISGEVTERAGVVE